MKCKKSELFLLRSFDIRLNDEEKEELEKHLKTCPICQAKKQEYETLFALMAEGKPPEPKAYFWERLQARIKERKKISFWPSVKQWSLRAIPFSLLIVLLIALVITFFSPPRDQELSQSEVLLLRNMNPLQETQLLLDERLENQNMMIIFSSMEERDKPRRQP